MGRGPRTPTRVRGRSRPPRAGVARALRRRRRPRRSPRHRPWTWRPCRPFGGARARPAHANTARDHSTRSAAVCVADAPSSTPATPPPRSRRSAKDDARFALSAYDTVAPYRRARASRASRVAEADATGVSSIPTMEGDGRGVARDARAPLVVRAGREGFFRHARERKTRQRQRADDDDVDGEFGVEWMTRLHVLRVVRPPLRFLTSPRVSSPTP